MGGPDTMTPLGGTELGGWCENCPIIIWWLEAWEGWLP